MFKFGNLEINKVAVLAPMAGITSSGYRVFMDQFHPGYMVSEMVSDMGLIYDNEETKTYVMFDKLSCPVGVQLFGHDPECLKKAAFIAQNLNKNIDFFDINMGCPVPKVTKPGSGSALMQNPKLCGEIIRAIKSITDKPVSAKIRLGWDDKSINFLEVIHELEEAGVDLIAIHARTKKELYTGNPHFDLLKDLRGQMKVPLVVSGNIYTLDDAIHAKEITGADAVMVARGGQDNPFLIEQTNHYFETGERLLEPSLNERVHYCFEMAKCIVEEKGESRGMRVFRAMGPKLFYGIPNAKEFRYRLASQLTTLSSLEKIVNEYLENNNI